MPPKCPSGIDKPAGLDRTILFSGPVGLSRKNRDQPTILCTMLRGFDGTRESEHDSASESEHDGAREPIYNHNFCRKRKTRHEIILNLLIARMIEFRDFRPKSTTF